MCVWKNISSRRKGSPLLLCFQSLVGTLYRHKLLPMQTIVSIGKIHFNCFLSPRLSILGPTLVTAQPVPHSCNTPISTTSCRQGRFSSPMENLWVWIPLHWPEALTEALRSVIPEVGSGVSRCIDRPLSGFLCSDSQGRDRVLHCSVPCFWTSFLPSWRKAYLVFQLVILA